MNLTAHWTGHQDPTIDKPYRLLWQDGRSATLTDYEDHLAVKINANLYQYK
jgi:hypothetical protein